MSDFLHELKHDHHVIQQVAAAMSAVAGLLDSGKRVEPGVLVDLVQFLGIFAGECHCAKEEKYLFPLLETKGDANASRELRQLAAGHRQTARLVERLAKVAGAYTRDPVTLQSQLSDVLRQLAEIYPTQIWKEDYLLFPMAQQTLSEAEQELLKDRFQDVELEIGGDVHAAFELLAKSLGAIVEFRNSAACPLCAAAA